MYCIYISHDDDEVLPPGLSMASTHTVMLSSLILGAARVTAQTSSAVSHRSFSCLNFEDDGHGVPNQAQSDQGERFSQPCENYVSDLGDAMAFRALSQTNQPASALLALE